MIRNRLLEIRLELGYKFAKDFAEFLGIHPNMYSRLENNSRQPSLESALKIAKKLNKTLEEIVSLVEND